MTFSAGSPFFSIMIGGEVTCIESMEGAEVFGEEINNF